MSKIFKDAWKDLNKSHDVPIQNELDGVKEDAPKLDEQVDKKEDKEPVKITATQPYAFPKPDVHKSESYRGSTITETSSKMDTDSKYFTRFRGQLIEGNSVQEVKDKIDSLYTKNTVHVTYDDDGVPTNSYVDESDGTMKRMEVEDCPKCFGRGSRKINGEIVKCPTCRGSGVTDVEKGMTNGEEDNPRSEQVEKPGDSPHTTDWDKCVLDVQSKNPKSNAYAICTAKLGEQAFKSQYRHMAYVKTQIKKARQEVEKMGVGTAGAIPNSLLARQDLEPVADLEEAIVQEGKDELHQN